jgi:hypothetical protein
MTVAFNKFNCLTQDIANKKHDLSADTIKVLLTNTAPVNTNAIKADITEISSGNGYTAGGNQASQTSSTQTSGVEKLLLQNPATWTASGGSIGPFRYAVMYNDTQTSPAKPLIGWYDYGSAITLGAGEQFQVALDQTNGVFTIA